MLEDKKIYLITLLNYYLINHLLQKRKWILTQLLLT